MMAGEEAPVESDSDDDQDQIAKLNDKLKKAGLLKDGKKKKVAETELVNDTKKD